MKIDKFIFDKKGRYYNFYLCIEKWVFMIVISIINFGFEIHVGNFSYIPDYGDD